MTLIDPYTVLGVRPDADDNDIALAHRRLLRHCHPDIVGAAGIRRTQEINEAYDLLRDAGRRRAFRRPAPEPTRAEAPPTQPPPAYSPRAASPQPAGRRPPPPTTVRFPVVVLILGVAGLLMAAVNGGLLWAAISAVGGTLLIARRIRALGWTIAILTFAAGLLSLYVSVPVPAAAGVGLMLASVGWSVAAAVYRD